MSLVDSCQPDDCSPEPTAKRKIIPGTKFDLDLTLSPSSSLPDLSDLDGQKTPDDEDTTFSDIHDGEPDDLMSNSVFGPVLDWEGEILRYRDFIFLLWKCKLHLIVQHNQSCKVVNFLNGIRCAIKN